MNNVPMIKIGSNIVICVYTILNTDSPNYQSNVPLLIQLDQTDVQIILLTSSRAILYPYRQCTNENNIIIIINYLSLT